ncbi:MAG TPA: bifunctional precorrin-2 dehydrogenase/sirohydrochlorin ferrochelatase [Tissierellaceae bacterium]
MYYPVMLDLKNKEVLVVGAGKVAYRKIKNLIKAKAKITVVSNEFLKEFESLNVNLIKDCYNEKYLKGKFLVIAATSNNKVNEKIAKDAKENSILCNVVDNKEISDFITPAVVSKEEVLISISTNGKYPALSKYIRKDLEDRYSKYTKEYLELLETLRLEVIKRNEDDKEKLLKEVLEMNEDDLREFVFKYLKEN